MFSPSLYDLLYLLCFLIEQSGKLVLGLPKRNLSMTWTSTVFIRVLVCVWVVWAKRKYTLEKLRIKQTNMKSQNKQSPSTSTRYKETKALGKCAGEGKVTTTSARMA